MKCLQCGVEFEGRSDARYCSASCRVTFNRNKGISVTDNVTDKFLDLEGDLGLDACKDLGISSWTKDGIMIRPDITVEQVRRIARLVSAKHGNPEKVICRPRDWREYA